MSGPITFRKRLARNTAASMATNVWTVVLTFGTLPLLLEGLGATAFGAWVFLQTFSATNGWLSVPTSGLATSSTRQLASRLAPPDVDRRATAVASTFVVFVVTGLILSAALALLTPTLLAGVLDIPKVGPDSLRLVGLAFGVQVLAEHLFLAVTSVLEGGQEVATARFIDAGRRTCTAVGTAFAASLGLGLDGVAIAGAGASSGVTVLALVGLRTTGRLSVKRPTPSDLRTLVSYASTVSALAGTGVLHRTMDRTIAGVVLGPGAVALVEVANQVQAGATSLLSAGTYPVLSSAPMLHSAGDTVALQALFRRLTRYSVLVTFPLCALAIVLAGPFVRVWLGSEYVEAVGLIQVAVVYVLLVAPLQAGSNLLQGVGRAQSVLWASSTSVLVNLTASLVLVQLFGVVGVFLGTIVGAITLLPLLLRPITVTIEQPAFRDVCNAVSSSVPPALAAGAGAAATLWLDWPPVAVLVSGGALGVTAAVCTALKWSVRRGEREELLAALHHSR